MGRSRKRKTPDRTWIKQVLTGALSGLISTLVGESLKLLIKWILDK